MKISNVFYFKFIKSITDRYKDAELEDRRIINTSLVLVIFFSIVFIIPEALLPEDFPHNHAIVFGFLKALSAIALGIIVGIGFVISDRLDVLLPIRRSIDEAIDTLKEDINENRIMLTNNLEIMQSYNVYRTSRVSFGLKNVSGLRIVDDRIERINVLVKELRRAEKGTVVNYMNTFVEDVESLLREIQNAVDKGVVIKLLLLDPNVSQLTYSRYSDAYLGLYPSQEDFQKHMINKLQELWQRCTRMETSLSIKSGGRVEIRFYTKSLNFPMISVYGNLHGKSEHIRTFTGFYSGKSTEDMPYIEWGEGDIKTYTEFNSIFDRKWNACRNNNKI